MGILDGKVAVITGAGGGIGRAHALLFAREGARVVVNDLGCDRDGAVRAGGAGDGDRDGTRAAEVVAEIRASGGQAVASGEAVGTFAGAARIVQAALDAFGRLDVLVNNAGILRDRTVLNTTEEEWDQVIRVHLTGTFACLQAAARVMKEQGAGGRIINTTSSSGLLGNFGQANYGAAKVGVHALTRIAAMELAKYGITVNAVAPFARTRMTADVPEYRESLNAGTMAPEYISPLVAYLASDAARGITGTTFGVECNRLFVYKMMTSHGVTKRDDRPWIPAEIGNAIQQIVDW